MMTSRSIVENYAGPGSYRAAIMGRGVIQVGGELFMTQVISRSRAAVDVEFPVSSFRLQMLPAVPMTQEQFYDLCQQNRKTRLERTAQGELIIMAPAGWESGVGNCSVSGQLYLWSRQNGTGIAADSSAGYILPNGANRSPDASWVSHEKLALIPAERKKKFLPACPDFVIEILSPTDILRQTLEKMEEYIGNGTKLGWLLNPRNQQVHVFRPGRDVEILENPASLAGDPELPGFVLDLEAVWQS